MEPEYIEYIEQVTEPGPVLRNKKESAPEPESEFSNKENKEAQFPCSG